ncbi:MAG: DUF192 domain-containing protein [Chlamydiales bacterium]|nr:DUF192 domain-containing protein [Chlamydiales bacterium]
MLLSLCLFLEHAVTPEQREQGLMYREALAENSGMTFNYEEPQKLTFWSKNCLIDLDLAFLDSEKVIQEIYLLPAEPLTAITSKKRAQYAVEMNAGWFKKHEVKVGDQLQWKTGSSCGEVVGR